MVLFNGDLFRPEVMKDIEDLLLPSYEVTTVSSKTF